MKRGEVAIRLVGWTVGIAAFVAVARNAHIGDSLPVLRSIGPAVLLALLPYFVQIALDAKAWQTLLGSLGHRVNWPRLISIRLATEAFLLTVPGGSFVGESLKPYLLTRTTNVPMPHAVASIAIKRSLLALAQAIYIGLALVLGYHVLADHSHAIIGTDWLPVLVGMAAAFLLVAALGLGITFMHGRVATRLLAMLERLPWQRLRWGLAKRRAGFASADEAFHQLGHGHRDIASAIGWLLAAWLVETGETWLLCRLVGIDLPLLDIFAMEACVVFVRNLAFFVPAGLGVQDAGYLAFLTSFGIASPVAAAFAVLKRCKELVWVVAGYTLFAVIDRKPTLVALGGLE